jgi:hypothetical protein
LKSEEHFEFWILDFFLQQYFISVELYPFLSISQQPFPFSRPKHICFGRDEIGFLFPCVGLMSDDYLRFLGRKEGNIDWDIMYSFSNKSN